MRRLVLTLLFAATLAELTACSNGYGGSSLGSDSNRPASLVFTNAAGSYVSFFKIAPEATSPVAITAIGSKAAVSWSIRYGTTADTYQRVDTATGLITYPSCPAVAANANAAASALVSYTAGREASTIGVSPAPLRSPPATAPLGSGTAASPVYCLVLTATADNLRAPVTVLVGN